MAGFHRSAGNHARLAKSRPARVLPLTPTGALSLLLYSLRHFNHTMYPNSPEGGLSLKKRGDCRTISGLGVRSLRVRVGFSLLIVCSDAA